jgi:hypothetical protein
MIRSACSLVSSLLQLHLRSSWFCSRLALSRYTPARDCCNRAGQTRLSQPAPDAGQHPKDSHPRAVLCTKDSRGLHKKSATYCSIRRHRYLPSRMFFPSRSKGSCSDFLARAARHTQDGCMMTTHTARHRSGFRRFYIPAFGHGTAMKDRQRANDDRSTPAPYSTRFLR